MQKITTIQCIMGMIAWDCETLYLKDWPSVKIGPHENFPLYSIMYNKDCKSAQHTDADLFLSLSQRVTDILLIGIF